MQFIYIRIRYGVCSIGVGRSHSDAMDKSSMVSESSDFEGVTDMKDAIAQLRQNGYKIASIVVPEHVEELSE